MKALRMVLVVSVVLTAVFSSYTAARAAEPIKIGAAYALQGVWSDWTKRNLIAMEMAIEEINAAGGVNGMPLKSILYDTASKPDEATRVVRKLADDDKVLAVLGPFSSSECEVVFPVGNRIGIVMITQASSKPGVAAANRPYAFRNKVDELRLAIPAVTKWKENYKIKSVAIVHDAKDAVGLSLGTQVLPGVCKTLGLEIVNDGKYVTYQTGDFDMRAQVTRLKDFKFDGMVFGGIYGDAVTFIKEARRQGVNQPMVCGNPAMHFNFPIRAGSAADGVYTSSEFYYWMAKESVKKFTAEYVSRAKKKNFDPPEPLQFDVNVYDSVYMLAQVMKTQGVTNKPADLAKDRELIMKGLSNLKGFKGLASDIDFDKNGDAIKKVYVVKAQNGQWVLVE